LFRVKRMCKKFVILRATASGHSSSEIGSCLTTSWSSLTKRTSEMYSRAVRFIGLLTLIVSLASIAAWPVPEGQASTASAAKTKRAKKDKGTSETSDQNASAKATAKLDLNTATKEELD